MTSFNKFIILVISFAVTELKTYHSQPVNYEESSGLLSTTSGLTSSSWQQTLRPATRFSPASSVSLCDKSVNQTTDQQLQNVMFHVDTLTTYIQELDEVVQEMRLIKACECAESAASSSSDISKSAYVSKVNATPDILTETLTFTTESFTDSPAVEGSVRRRREKSEFDYYGMPNQHVLSMSNQTLDELSRAASDLRSLGKDLSVTADLLRQTNHTVHSAVLKALQAYVTSIERRVDNQRQAYVETRVSGLKPKIAIIKERIANLNEKLRFLVLPKHYTSISREDIGVSSNNPGVTNIKYSMDSLPTKETSIITSPDSIISSTTIQPILVSNSSETSVQTLSEARVDSIPSPVSMPPTTTTIEPPATGVTGPTS